MPSSRAAWILGAGLIAGAVAGSRADGSMIEADDPPAQPEVFRCPVQRYAPKVPPARRSAEDAAGMLAAALGSAGAPAQAVQIETRGVAGYAGVIAGVVGVGAGAGTGSGAGAGPDRTAAILPLLWCEREPCAGAPLRFPGARSVRLHALIDLAGFDGDVDLADDGSSAAPVGGASCMRWPALIVELADGSERGEDSLLLILSLRTSKLKVVHSERSHRGAEGGSRVDVLRFRGTRGGSPSDLVVLRRRQGRAAGARGPEVSQHLFNFVDGRYQYAP